MASGRYPVQPRGLPLADSDKGRFSFLFARGGRLDQRRDWAPMLDLLYAAANDGTGKRAALAIPTFGKTGTSQDNRDAVFVGFAGNLVVGVWVGNDDNSSLGKISGGTAPAEIWRSFMVPAVAVDGRSGPALPSEFRVPERQPKQGGKHRSPLPDDWSESTRAIREIAGELRKLFDER